MGAGFALAQIGTDRQSLPICLLTAVQGHRMWKDMLGILADAHRQAAQDSEAKGISQSLGHTTFPLTLTSGHSPSKLMTTKRWYCLVLGNYRPLCPWQLLSPGRDGWLTGFCFLCLDGSWHPRLAHLASSYLFREAGMSLTTF